MSAYILLIPTAIVAWWMGRVPYKVRARRWARLREEFLAKQFAEHLHNVNEITWDFAKEHAHFIYAYFRKGEHRVKRDRLAFWWEQTKPRYSNIMWKV